MKKILLFALLFSVEVNAQQILNQRKYVNSSSAHPVNLVPLGNDKFLVGGYNSIGYDSSHAAYFVVDENTDVVSHNEWKLFYPQNYMNDVTVLSNRNYMLCGTGIPTFGPDHPYLLVSDSTGSMVWAKWFDNLSYNQTQIVKIFPYSNSTLTAYTYPGGGFSRSIYRLEGANDGNTFTAKVITADTANQDFRIYHGVTASSPEDHILCGGGKIFPSATGMNAFMMRVKQDSVVWSRQYDFGSTLQEDFWDVIKTPDNNYLAVGYSSDVTNQLCGLLMKFTEKGNIIWSKKIKLSYGNLFLLTAAYTADNKILAIGYDPAYTTVLLKLDDAGNLISEKKWQTISMFNTILRNNTSNIIKVLGTCDGHYIISNLDVDGNGCNLLDISGTQVSDIVPTVYNTPMSMNSFSVTTKTETTYSRNYNYTPSDLCVTYTSDDKKIADRNTIEIYPNPADDFLNITLPSSSTIAIYNLFSQEMYFEDVRQKNKDTRQIDVSAFLNGIYFVQLKNQNTEILNQKYLKFVVQHYPVGWK